MPTQAPLILVVGMHRSGTSLLGSLLQALGVALPGQLIGADQHNPEGYYEWQEVVDLQERLLIDLDRWWPSEQGCLPLPEGWMQHAATLETRRRLIPLLREQAATQTTPWAIKDPRTSRLLPLWLNIAAQLAIPLRLILAVRDPAEVAQSLIQRDGPITGMDLSRAQALWWIHNLEPIQAASAVLPPLVVDYGTWFHQPQRQLERLLAVLPELRASPEQVNRALASIRPEHRRSQFAAEALPLDPLVRRLNGRLLRPRPWQRWPAPEPPRRLSPAPELPDPADPDSWDRWLEARRHHPAPRYAAPAVLAPQAVLQVCGPSFHSWQSHLWLQHLPIPALASCSLQGLQQADRHQLTLKPPPGLAQPAGFERLALNLHRPPAEGVSSWLASLRTAQVIWDPDPSRVLLLRALGLPAYGLDPLTQANGWLQQPAAATASAWSTELGMTPPLPGQQIVLGSAGSEWHRALAQEAAQPSALSVAKLAYWPSWPELITSNPAAALAQAGWLAAAAGQAAAVVWIAPELDPALDALIQPNAQLLCAEPPLTPADLEARLSGIPLQALAEDRPAPPQQMLWQWQNPEPLATAPAAAVVVSLFNYADRIEAALASVAAQTKWGLELIVVDDASSDDGAAVVQRWMQAQVAAGDHPFVRLLLLRHAFNAGLAAARNSAFAAALAPWCFVLDADNALYPAALESCLAFTQGSDPHLAVIHPLLAVEAEAGRPDEQRSLVGPQSWQAERFRFGNYVDAMALVRRSAWQAVGGYTHIEGGWEDYDFWCKLVEAGWHGVQCPQLLAVYRSHAQSMSHRSTNRNWPALSRTLQQRHPWLNLPLAR